MTILQINSVNKGSTGNIMLDIDEYLRSNNINSFIAVPKSRENCKKQFFNEIFIGNRFSRNLHLILGYFSGLKGCFSYFSTLMFLHKINKINPDIIQIHNLHDGYINLRLFFNYIKRNNIKVVWTFHDCWAFTGQCPHFTMENCNKWIEGCYSCPQYNSVYPRTKIDRTSYMWKLKKKYFSSIENLTIVTPSIWLSILVKQSFLRNKSIKVINNGINKSIFKPVTSDFREKFQLQNKYILLGVSFSWGKRKGLDVFIELSKRIDSSMAIVLVGTNDSIDQLLPSNIISIHHTDSQKELAEIYSAADLFINPTREENYPTVNMEALSCGTPVLTFNTGGSPEIIDESCGEAIESDDMDLLVERIRYIYYNNCYTKDACLKRAKKFSKNDKYALYFNLYKKLLDEN